MRKSRFGYPKIKKWVPKRSEDGMFYYLFLGNKLKDKPISNGQIIIFNRILSLIKFIC